MHLRAVLIALLLSIDSRAAADNHWRPTAIQWEILGMSRQDTLHALGTVVRSTPDSFRCYETTYRRLGLMPSTGELYYVVSCSGGEKYTVNIAWDSVGSTSVMDCAFLKVLNINCDTLDSSEYIQP